MVTLHPSSTLEKKPAWVLFNEFVLTTKNYIRTVTVVQPDWLLSMASNYYDLRNFPKCEALKALEELILRKRVGGGSRGGYESRDMDSGSRPQPGGGKEKKKKNKR